METNGNLPIGEPGDRTTLSGKWGHHNTPQSVGNGDTTTPRYRWNMGHHNTSLLVEIHYLYLSGKLRQVKLR